ncbi:MAG: hypothetical protein AAGA85_01845 [Bacteroidota bacterium]
MSREYKIRRGSFKQGQIQRHKDFNRFRREYEERRRRELRTKVLLALAIVTLILAIVFGVAANPVEQSPPLGHPELQFENADKNL